MNRKSYDLILENRRLLILTSTSTNIGHVFHAKSSNIDAYSIIYIYMLQAKWVSRRNAFRLDHVDYDEIMGYYFDPFKSIWPAKAEL